MQDNIFISIIIPFYKVELPLLDRCLASITRQLTNEQAWEVIVVDDASPESPTEVCQRYPHTRLVMQEHRGLGGARNNGMQQAKGIYVLFVDADDYLVNDTLPFLWTILQKKRPDILRFNFRKVKGFGRIKIKCQEPTYKTYDTGEHLMECINLYDSVCTYIFRRQIIINNHIKFEEGVFIEDSLFTIRLHHIAQAIIVTSMVVYAYYQRANSIVHEQERVHKEELEKQHWNNLVTLDKMLHKEPLESSLGLRRKYYFYIIDYLYRILQMKTIHEITNTHIPQMRQKGMFPLPYKWLYGLKYNTFCFLSRFNIGLLIMQGILKRL